MGCARGLCAAQKVFIFINIAFAMYSGALLATAARLAWDPSTYTWFRFLCAAQYRVSAAYVLAAGLWLAALVYLAAASAAAVPAVTRRAAPLHMYSVGVVCLAASEVGYMAWMATSLERWWRSAPEAELARRGMDIVHDLKPALLAIDRYRDVARPIYDMIEEMEREAPNNVFVIIIFSIVAIILQVAAFVMARRLARTSGAGGGAGGGGGISGGGEEELTASEKRGGVCAGLGGGGECAQCDDSDSGDARQDPPPGWRKKANLRMYTILDKIF